VLLVGAVIGLIAFLHGQKFVTTDDAQIDANVTPLTARVSGEIQSIRFSDNQYVHIGDTLFHIEDSDYRIKLEQAQNALEAAKLNVNVSAANVLSYKANISTAESNIAAVQARLWKANEDYERYSVLMKNQATTQERLDAAKAEKDAAEAELLTTKSQLNGVNKQTDVAERQVDGATVVIRQRMTEVEYAKLQLSYTTIVSPVSGVISKRAVQMGQLVQPGTSLCAIVNVDSLYVTANFKETQMQRLHPGEKVTIKIDAFPNTPLVGTLASMSGATGAKFSLLPPDNATGNFVKVVQRMPVKIAIDAGQNLGKLIRPGMSVTVEVLTAK
jgi:membrane fusion protein (multidrug efflux system)